MNRPLAKATADLKISETYRNLRFLLLAQPDRACMLAGLRRIADPLHAFLADAAFQGWGDLSDVYLTPLMDAWGLITTSLCTDDAHCQSLAKAFEILEAAAARIQNN